MYIDGQIEHTGNKGRKIVEKIPSFKISIERIDSKFRHSIPYINEIFVDKENTNFVMILEYCEDEPLNKGDTIKFRVYISKECV